MNTFNKFAAKMVVRSYDRKIKKFKRKVEKTINRLEAERDRKIAKMS